MSRIAILGGGSWGTGLSIVLAHSRRKHEIRLWVREPSIAKSIEEYQENRTYLPGVAIPPSVRVSNEIAEALRDAQIVIGVVPSEHSRSVFLQAIPHLPSDVTFVSATKGLEPKTH